MKHFLNIPPQYHHHLHLPPITYFLRRLIYLAEFFTDLFSGYDSPLSSAILSRNCKVFRMDILIEAAMDIFSDDFYEQLLRFCACGKSAYIACSPCCREYSRLKLNPGPGPKPLRTPDHLGGVPGLGLSDTIKLQDSFLQLSRGVHCLRVGFSAGSHGHLEQPPNAMSWEESIVQQWIGEARCSCVNLPACKFGMNISKSWLFATSLDSLQQLGALCDHPRGTHTSIAGAKDSSGAYLSKSTAQYPVALAQAFADIVSPMIAGPSESLTFAMVMQMIPMKVLSDHPQAFQDGGGLFSFPDWSYPRGPTADIFRDLRQSFFKLILDNSFHKRIICHFHRQDSAPPFSPDELEPFREILEHWMTQHGMEVDWSVREHQPMHLGILHAFSKFMNDADGELFPHLIQGVPTGFADDIPPSNCFSVKDDDLAATRQPLSVHMDNWRSSSDRPDLTSELIAKEISEGWVEPFEGDVAASQQRWPQGVAIGRLGIALSEHRDPRLVVDSSICGTNSSCLVREHQALPTAKDILRTFPLRDNQHELGGFSIDVKAAHKRVVIKESERGLLGFSHNDNLYFYRVAPFGAIFSAHWWGRIGAFLVRLLHSAVYIKHALWLYVDDFLLAQRMDVLPLAAAFVSILLLLFAIPISWKKCILAKEVTWIGWCFNFSLGTASLDMQKRIKLIKLIQALESQRTIHKRDIERFLGLAMWVTQLFPGMRPLLQYFYADLFSAPASLYSLDPGAWPSLSHHLDNDLRFITTPPGTGIPTGGVLISVRHQAVTHKADLARVRLSEKRIWLRIRNPSSNKRKLSTASQRCLRIFMQWLSILAPLRSMYPKPVWPGFSAADACATGSTMQMGGFVEDRGQHFWFSEQFQVPDFIQLGLPMRTEAQKDIACYETLAQMALLYVFSKRFPHQRMKIILPTVSDNTSAESGVNQLFTTSEPLCFFLEKLGQLSSSLNVDMDTSHISGTDNSEADLLSRWNFQSPLPTKFTSEFRVRITLEDLWMIKSSPSIHPSNLHLKWALPS